MFTMEYLKDKFTQTYSVLADYYYGTEEKIQNWSKLTLQDKILVLRKVLKSQCVYSQEVQGKIQMQFTTIIKSSEYKKFSFSTEIPSQYPVPKILPEKKLICFSKDYYLQTDTIKCLLLIQILFEENFPQTLPKFYIKTPNLPQDTQSLIKFLRTAKPNKKFVEIVKSKSDESEPIKKYTARTDGIEVILSQRNSEWKMDVKELLDECIEILKNEFPFVKMKQPVMLVDIQANIDAKTKFLYDKSQKIKQILQNPIEKVLKQPNQPNQKNLITEANQEQIQNQLPYFLETTQYLDIISKERQSQINYMKEQSIKMTNAVKQMEKDIQNINKTQGFSSIYPVISQDPVQKQLFEILVDHEASKDCLIEVERYVKQQDKFQHKLLDSTELKKTLNLWQTINQKIFFQRYRINQIIKEIQSKQNKHNE